MNALDGGWVLYDEQCSMCGSAASRIAPLLAPYGYRILPLQTDWVRNLFALPEAELLREMRVLTLDGGQVGGADAVVHLWGIVWWARPLAWLARIPGVMPPLRIIYRWVAENRGCAGGRCEIAPRRTP